ncbi:MAG TPA: hypothetical protein VG890_13570 [Puia sp.]|nr:hypothetical protein [Puia sp.]
MNTLKTWLCICTLLCCLNLAAQNKSFPENIPYQSRYEVSPESLENLFKATGHFTIPLSPDLAITGTVQSRTEKSNSVTNLLIQTENLNGAMLSLSRSSNTNGLVHYTGHLLKLHEQKGMLLVEKEGHYYFIRTEQRYLVAE